METKWIRHPNLPDGQEVEVPAQSVGHHAHAGWVVMDEPPKWATVRPEDAAMAELTSVAREAAGMPEAPAARDGRSDEELQRIASEASGTDKDSDSESAPGNDGSDDESGDQEDKPTGAKRSRRAPTKEGK